MLTDLAHTTSGPARFGSAPARPALLTGGAASCLRSLAMATQREPSDKRLWRYLRSAARVLRDLDWASGYRGWPIRYEDDTDLWGAVERADMQAARRLDVPRLAANLYLEPIGRSVGGAAL